ncbi:MAG: OmpA family protein [Pelagibacterales bacterium]|nr:OmpA family protein [Pelagibacterales bacterium]
MKKSFKYLTIILFIIIFNNNLFSQTEVKEKNITVQKAKDNSKNKLADWLVDKLSKKNKIPSNYVPVSEIKQIPRDSFSSIEIINGREPELSLKVFYPRVTPTKSFVSFQVGDFKYFTYLNNISINDIEHLKLTSNDGSECYVVKFKLVPKKELSIHYSIILDHSGSMGGKKASMLQKSVFNAIKKDLNFNKTDINTYSIYKFDTKNKRIVQSNNILEIENEIMPPRRLKGFGGRTAIKDAILTGVGDLIKDKESESKIMVLFTDGETNSDKSPLPMEDVIKVALHKKINIVTVAYGSELTNAYLENISNNSGGSLNWIFDESEFEPLFDNILKDFHLSYDLEFSPCLFAEEVEIELKIKGIDDYLVGTTLVRGPRDKGYSIDLNILFDNAKWFIKEINHEKLDRLLKFMNSKPSIKILVEGHTDRLGSDKSNQILSEKRANSVKEYLIEKGISADRIATKGYGSKKPAYDYADSDVNALNRRIEVVLID